MDETRRYEELLWFICRQVLRLAEIELERFAGALEDWVNTLLSERLPADWQRRVHAYLDEWDAEFEVLPEHRANLVAFIESWGKARGRMPVSEPLASTSRYPFDEFIRSQVFELGTAAQSPAGLGAHNPLERSDTDLGKNRGLNPTAPPRRIKSIEERKGLGMWYDEAVADGYEPNFLTRMAVSITRGLLPDSEPTKIVTYTDGTVEIQLGGGPTSGGLGVQAATLLGLKVAIGKGEVVAEVVETVVDTAVQEATGSPIGPSSVKSLGGGPRLKTETLRLTQQPTTRTLTEVRQLPQPERWKAGEQYVQELYGSGGQRHFAVPEDDSIEGSGGRFVDAPLDASVGGVVAMEVKTYGQLRTVRGVPREQTVPLTDAIRQQILKDAWLRDHVANYDPRWTFIDAPPSPELAEFLRHHRIVNVTYTK